MGFAAGLATRRDARSYPGFRVLDDLTESRYRLPSRTPHRLPPVRALLFLGRACMSTQTWSTPSLSMTSPNHPGCKAWMSQPARCP